MRPPFPPGEDRRGSYRLRLPPRAAVVGTYSFTSPASSAVSASFLPSFPFRTGCTRTRSFPSWPTRSPPFRSFLRFRLLRAAAPADALPSEATRQAVFLEGLLDR